MTTKYRLPDRLGGHVVKLLHGMARDDDRILVEDEVLGCFELPDEWRRNGMLTEVVPPLPPEPPVGGFWACGTDSNLLPFFRRWEEGWLDVGGGSEYVTWADIVERSRRRAKRDPVQLVPDPAADAPELPYYLYGDQGETVLRVTTWPSLEHPRTACVEVLGRTAEISEEELVAAIAAMSLALRNIRAEAVRDAA